MKKLIACALLIQLFFGCKKETIDVSLIHQTDNVGNPIAASQADHQWMHLQFTQEEMDLFIPLDTASLQGTFMPANINPYFPPYPNPFQTTLNIYTAMPSSSLNSVVLKYVIVDKYWKVVQRGAYRPPIINNGVNVQILTSFSPGKYRLYLTFSTEARENFLTTWGNIQKIP